MTFPFGIAAMGLAEFAPIISQWLGGPKIESIGQKIIHLAKEIGQNSDLQSVIETFREDPQKAFEFQESVLKLETELEIAYVMDRQDARKREATMMHQGKSMKRADIMVLAAMVGLAACLLSLGFYQDALPGEAVGIISTISGIFGACLKDAYAFEFGSSRGSRQKDETMAAMIDQL